MVYNLALLLPCTVCLIGAVWLIFKRRSNTLSQNILAVGFLVSTLSFLCTANYIAGFLDCTTFMWWDITDSFSTMLLIPVMYLYFRSTIREEKFTWKEWLWFVPALVVGLGTSILYMLMDKTGMEAYVQTALIERKGLAPDSDTIYKLHRFVGYRIYHFTTLFQIVGTSISCLLGLKKYHQRLYEFYSDADDRAIYIDRKILHWYLCSLPLALTLIVPNIKFWREYTLLTSFFFVAWAVVFFAFFYYGSQKRHTVENFVQDLQQANIEENSYCEVTTEEADVCDKEVLEKQISPEVYQRLVVLFTKLIDEEKVYLKNDLRLDELARRMFTNRKYVSIFIKDTYHCSFSDYINRKRIDFSMKLMCSKPNLTQDKIAEESGFINAQSYSRTFKKMVGIPPKEWLNRNISCS